MSSPMYHDIQYGGDLTADPETLLPLLGGICWTIVYVLIIVYTAVNRDKLYIPITAFSMNLVWEGIYSFVIPVPAEQELIDRVWFVLDCIILVLAWRNYFYIHRAEGFLKSLGYLLANLLGGIYVNWVFITINITASAFYSAFVINVAMSVLFLISTQETRNLWIAIFKMLGTAITSIYAYLYIGQSDLVGRTEGEKSVAQSAFMVTTYVTIFVLDIAYIIQCLAARRALKRAQLAVLPEKLPLQ